MVRLKDGRDVDLELFKFDTCPFCVRVLAKLRQLGVEGVRLRDTRREPGAAEELVERGGKLQVPCLFVDGEPMYESQDISEWLEANVATTAGESA
ncbi:MAG: glutaredoxin [Planctomycetota bacterium]|nr:MAG: glutaredoxin [Planctomycetota bacterium]